MAEAAKVDMSEIMESPEVKAAIQEAAAKAAAEAVALLAKSGDGQTFAVDEATRSLFGQLALSIADMANQGSGRTKPVSPAVMQQREAAAQRCRDLVEAARERGDKPEYRVVAKIYFNERLIEPFRKESGREGTVVAQEIVWTGIPNEALRPLNAVAEEIYAAYRESIGSMPVLTKVSYRDGRGGLGVVAQDNRPYSMTPNGLVVKGDSNPRRALNVDHEFADDVQPLDNNDPRAPEVAILGTVAPKARKNFADPSLNQGVRAR